MLYRNMCMKGMSSLCCYKVATSGTGKKPQDIELINFQNQNKNEKENMINGKGIHLLFLWTTSIKQNFFLLLLTKIKLQRTDTNKSAKMLPTSLK